VRQEYFFRSETEWSRERRPSLLPAFLDRPRIFLTPEFASFEAPARANLTRSLARLTADPAPPRSAP
jgi:predicted metal-dependent HD superfamily phosphohydrolase